MEYATKAGNPCGFRPSSHNTIKSDDIARTQRIALPLEELLRNHDPNSSVQYGKLQRRLPQQFAIDLDADLRRRFDADTAAPLLQDMPNPVNPAVEQITEAEQDMPEMDGTDQRLSLIHI